MRRDELLAARTGTWGDDERARLAELVAALRPSPSHLDDILDWLDDISARDGLRPAAVLDTPTLASALASRGSAPDRLKRWKQALRRLRYPRLVAREHAFATAVRGLALPRGVTIAPPPALEGGTVTVTIRAGSAAELATNLDRLGAACRDGTIAALFDVLD